MTQITRKSVPMRGLILLLAMFLGAGLVLSGCGDDDTATTPAPAPPPPPPPAPEPEPEPEPEPPPAPMAPATPTGLMVSATAIDSITWSWDASEGAIGYAVQVSLDEMFDDMDQVGLTLETSFTASPVPPETNVYLRVAAGIGTPEAITAAVTMGDLSGLVMSAWSTHVTGRTDMIPVPPPPPPPTPDPVMVTFSLSEDADSPHFLVADDDDDEDTAMAKVNTEIMVESNSTAVITPMFVDGATGVSVDAMAGNMPFTYVDWELMQSAVLSDGATFMVQRTTVGANQEMEPTGDVMYVTCGPFECMEGEDAPMLSIENSAVCTAWDPSVEIHVGEIDNDVVDADTTDTVDDRASDGVDLGFKTSSNGIAMTVKHVFSGVSNGANSSTPTDAAKGSDKTLTMKAVTGVIMIDDPDTEDVDEACNNVYDPGDITDKPPGCFRLIGPGAMGRKQDKGPNYLGGYSLEFSPKDADVAWGRVDWEDDPFEELTCGDADAVMVSDLLSDSGQNICEDLFEAEVDYAIGEGWTPTVVFETDDSATNDNQLVMWRAKAENAGAGTAADAADATAKGKRFKTLWFDDDLDGKIENKNDRRPTVDGTPTGAASAEKHDLYNQNGGTDNANIEVIWMHLTDSDGDPTAGDLGKADLVSDEDDNTTVDDERTILVEACATGAKWRKIYDSTGNGTADMYTCGTDDAVVTSATPGTATDDSPRQTHPDGNADNYGSGADSSTAQFADVRKCSDDDGGDDDENSSCDASWSSTHTVTFTDGTFNCMAEREVTISCEWDADGGMAQGRNALPDGFDAATNLKNFLECKVS